MRKVTTTEYCIESEHAQICVRRQGARIIIKQKTHNGDKEMYVYPNDILQLEACFRKCLEEEENG